MEGLNAGGVGEEEKTRAGGVGGGEVDDKDGQGRRWKVKTSL